MSLQQQVNTKIWERAEGLDLKLRKITSTGETPEFERFNPYVLIKSLLEAEVPLNLVIDVYEAVIDDLYTFKDLEEITERIVHGRVSTVLASFPHDDAALWFRVYSGNSLDIPKEIDKIFDPNVVPVSGLKGDEVVDTYVASNIKYLVEGYYEVSFGNFDGDESETLTDIEDVRHATNEIVKIFRSIGLRYARVSTVQSLLADLGSYSFKRPLDAPDSDPSSIKRLSALATRNLQAAKSKVERDRASAKTFYRISLEYMSEVLLNSVGIPSRPAKMSSFLVLKETVLNTGKSLEAFQGIVQSSQAPKADALSRKLKSQSQSPKHHVKEIFHHLEILAEVEKSFGPMTLESARVSQDYLLQIGSNLNGVGVGRSYLSRFVSAIISEETPENSFTDCLQDFSEKEIGKLAAPFHELENVLVIPSLHELRRRANFLEFGRSVVIAYLDLSADELLSPKKVAEILVDWQEESEHILVVVARNEPDEKLKTKMSQWISDRRVFVWVDFQTANTLFRNRDGFFTKLDEVIERTYHGKYSYRYHELRDADVAKVPQNITGYPRSQLGVLFRYFSEENYLSIQAILLSFLEEMVLDYKSFLTSVVLSTDEGRHCQAVNSLKKETSNSLLGQVGKYLDHYRLAEKQCESDRITNGLKVAEALGRFSYSLRAFRNSSAHNPMPPDDIFAFFSRSVSALRELCKFQQYPKLVVFDKSRVSVVPLFDPEYVLSSHELSCSGVFGVWELEEETIFLEKAVKVRLSEEGASFGKLAHLNQYYIDSGRREVFVEDVVGQPLISEVLLEEIDKACKEPALENQ